MGRLLENLLHLNHLRKFVGFEVLGAALKTEFKHKLIGKPEGKKVLVLAPHFDDDVLGCGGTLALHTLAKDQIQIVYLTAEASTAEIRKAEAKQAAKILGANELTFLDRPDGKLGVDAEIIKALSQIISQEKPDLIYTPTFDDPHPDHLATCQNLARALEQTPFAGQIFSYEIWSPIFANRLVKIDETIEQKKQAMLAHASQLKERSYLEALLGLASYRAGMFNHGKYAEAFFACDRQLYLKLFDLIKKTSGKAGIAQLS